jgi:hypothetical protein
MSGIREDDFLGGDDPSGELFATDPEALQRHINKSLYGIEPSWLRRKAVDLLGGCGAALLDESSRVSEQGKDLTSPLSADMYMEMRVAPLTKYYDNWVKSLSKLRTKLSVAVFLLLGVGSALAAFGFSLWIPVMMGLTTFLTSLLHWLAPPESITAVNNALTKLNNLDLRWHGSSLKEQRSDAMKNRVITMTERVMLAVATSLSQAPILPDEDVDEAEAVEEEAKQLDAVTVPASRASMSGRNTPRSHAAGGVWRSSSRGGSRLNSPRSYSKAGAGAWM